MMNKRPPIAVFAYSEVGFVCLGELLRQGANVVAVFTHEDDPNEEIWFQSVEKLARSRGILVRIDAKLGEETTELLLALRVELIFSFYYRSMIPIGVLEVPCLGAYNIHGALLPKYRGRACVNWAVLNGERETGATLHIMTGFADRGDIIDQERVPILYEDTAHAVFLKIAEASREIVARALPALEAGTAKRIPQDESLATKFGRRRPEDGRIDWNKNAGELYNFVRALTHPFPGAFTEMDGRKIFIWRARAKEGRAKPGEMVSDSPPIFGTGSGLLEALSWQYDDQPERDM